MLRTPSLESNRKSDLLGAMASGLCLVHCLATPLLFVAQAGAHHADSPGWWKTIDIALLVVSLAAVYWAAKKTSRNWMKWALYGSWLALTFLIVNEKVEGVHLAEAWIYVPTVSLVGLHLYNRKYCYCQEEGCCVDSATE